ncbi:MAG TPA: flagellar hook-basal body complex protein FliE [Phycisphaerales bacterium]|nr:flagellar hook-basal body complex protein FliE [Phycisphaerales bacterium]HRQ76153.1 flagellar hook-basal body complex protein FliE [Phycisphaerales bacterium]
MSDPLGLIGKAGGSGFSPLGSPVGPAKQSGPDFREVLRRQIDEVNALQQDAKRAVEDLAAGRRNDVESVIIATEKADVAFKMLLQVRNKVMDAYEEVKQIRV